MPSMNAVELKYSLAEQKFQHACFISWASLGGDQTKRLVEKLKQAVENNAPSYGLPSSVFCGEDIPTGADWQLTMSCALCASIAMIAVLEPEYYISDWCGREWSGMLQLEKSRLGSLDRTILPLLRRPLRSNATAGLLQLEVLPPPVQHLQCKDLSRIRLSVPNFEKSNAFGVIIDDLTKRIVDIGIRLADRRAGAMDCAGFILPTESTFAEFKQTAQRYPFLTES